LFEDGTGRLREGWRLFRTVEISVYIGKMGEVCKWILEINFDFERFRVPHQRQHHMGRVLCSVVHDILRHHGALGENIGTLCMREFVFASREQE
jgi:hypothetical protein